MSDNGDTVFVVDDDESIRSSLSMLLRSYGFDCHAFPSAQTFLERCAEGLPERCAAVLDLSMPVMNGLELQDAMQRRNIDVPVVFLSGDGDVPAAVDALQHGALDFIEKPVDSEILINLLAAALEAGAAGNRGEDLEEMRSRLDTLTARERQVLEGIAAGGTSRSIADEMAISERTVELHRSRILKKMGARNSTELLNHVLPALRQSGDLEQ